MVLVIMLLVAALAACGFLLKPVVTDPIRQAATQDYEAQLAEVDKQNQENQQAYQQALAAAVQAGMSHVTIVISEAAVGAIGRRTGKQFGNQVQALLK